MEVVTFLFSHEIHIYWATNKFQNSIILIKNIKCRKEILLGDINRSSCREGDVGRLCSSVG